jgi:nitrate/TMAO reductase-like tetraheme cytochrome c subunit
MRDFAAAGRRRRLVATVAALALASLVGGPTGWFVTDALERDNDFCNACHLTEAVPLHIDIRREFDAAVPVNLAGVHAGSQLGSLGSRPDDAAPFRCIDCHGGTGFIGRAKVKVLAAKDTLWWLTGHFDEPTGMAWPLQDADCRKCHGGFAVKAADFEAPAFHDIALHNVDLGVGCVECHLVHLKGDEANYFLDAPHTREQCARCHAEFID